MSQLVVIRVPGAQGISGESAYETWLAAGNVGSEDDFLESLRGTDGTDGLGLGDVVGPASAVADQIAVFSGVTGKLLKDGGSTILALQNATDQRLLSTNNLSDVANAATARGNLGANDAANLTTGTLPDARVSAALTADKAFRRGNILGVVSQSGGVPTGALVEYTSGVNGWAYKYADGRLECGIDTLAFADTSTANGSIFRSSADTLWTFPVTFIAAPIVSTGSTTASARWTSAGPPTTTNVSLRAFSGTSAATSMTASARASGRWFT